MKEPTAEDVVAAFRAHANKEADDKRAEKERKLRAVRENRQRLLVILRSFHADVARAAAPVVDAELLVMEEPLISIGNGEVFFYLDKPNRERTNNRGRVGVHELDGELCFYAWGHLVALDRSLEERCSNPQDMLLKLCAFFGKLLSKKDQSEYESS